MNRDESQTPIPVLPRILLLVPPGYVPRIGLSLLKPDLWFEARNDGEAAAAVIPLVGSDSKWHIDLEIDSANLDWSRQNGFWRELEIGRHHANHCVRLIAERDLLPDDLWISAETALP